MLSKTILALAVLLILAALSGIPVSSHDDPPISSTRSPDVYMPFVLGGQQISLVTPTPTPTNTPTATATRIALTLIAVTPAP